MRNGFPVNLARMGCALLVISGMSASLSLHAQPEVELTYLGQFGSSGSGAGDFRAPIAVDIDSQGQIWVLDAVTERVQYCDYSGNCEFFRNDAGDISSYLTPSDLAVDDQDRVLILERGTNRLLICDNQTASGCQTLGGGGMGLGELNSPYGVALNSQGNIVIADTDNRRLQQCDYSGNCTEFGVFALDPGAVAGPGVWYSPFSVGTGSDGTIIVGEVASPPGGPPTTGWIHTCNIQGQCSHRWGGFGTGEQNTTAPNALDVDDRGNVFVTDTGNARIKACNYEGQCLNFGSRGTGDMQFFEPSGLQLDGQNRLIVADTLNSRIQILRVTYLDEEPVFSINAGLNDAWFNPDTAGQGFFLTVFEDIQMMFLAWFTYDTERPPDDVEAILGEPGHRWITAFGPYDGDTAELDIEITSGGVFDSAVPAVSQQADGTVSVQFDGCNSGTVTYDIFSLALAGEVPIERIALDNVPVCEALLTR
jgi:sugar lactone lactonase YvrE